MPGIDVVPGIDQVMCDNQMGLGIHRGLGVVANKTAALGAVGHGEGIRIRQGYLTVRAFPERLADVHQAFDLLPDTLAALCQIGDLLCPDLTLFLTVDPDHFIEVALDTRNQMGGAARDLALGKVLVSIIVRLEFGAVDGNTIPLQHPDPATEFDELCTSSPNGGTVIAAKISECLVVRDQSPRQPHHLNIATSLPLQRAAGGHAVQIAVDKQLKQDRWVIAGPPCPRRRRPQETDRLKVDLLHKEVNHANRIVLVDPVFQPVR